MLSAHPVLENQHYLADKCQIEEEPLDNIREVSETVRDEQIKSIKEIKARRDTVAVQKVLGAVANCAGSDGNLLEAAISASRARATATVGGGSDAMEKVFGWYVATTRYIYPESMPPSMPTVKYLPP